ncbi:MAG TPA: heme-copper oxidase subunit III [Puia sp.]|jgi:cytochrome c oxidase subunit 3|nr:heme-copper oxidase subunit III [Puia sp.]
MMQHFELIKPVNEQRKKIHPHKFAMWIGIGSIIMMFAGLTSAYIVKRDQPGWTTFDIPRSFWYSTFVILISSLTMQIALKSFIERQMQKYKRLISITVFLGILFIVLQWISFRQIWNSGVTFKGSGAGQFLYVIAGLHALHVLGGIIALMVTFIKAFAAKRRNYSSVPLEVVTTYWHFVDVLWIYLFIFFLWIH